MRKQKPHFTIGRRRFLQLTASSLLYLAATRNHAMAATHAADDTAEYAVGVGKSSDAYSATIRALTAGGEWNEALLAGRTVLVKPNLVVAQSAETGATTDPHVVRAIVDTALAAGAVAVKIIEGYPGGDNFESCGYGFFADYDPAGRVSLVNLDILPTKLVNVPNGLAYQQMYMPELLFAPDTILVSAAKMKVHAETLVTLAVKNVFGLSAEGHYREQKPNAVGRFAMHNRGVQQAIVDHNLVRAVDFAVVDGVWAMERTGPRGGDRVAFDTVIAGSNAVAVDRVCLAAMGVTQNEVYYLALASNMGLGPYGMSAIELRGDGITPYVFELPDMPPVIDLPVAAPATIHATQGQFARVNYALDRASMTRIEVVKTSELTSQVEQIRLLQDWELRAAGSYSFEWDGRDDAGQIVGPGSYKVRVEATHGEAARNGFATSRVTVVDDASSNGVLELDPYALIFVGVAGGANPPAQNVVIGDFGGGPLAWNASTSNGWLQLSAPSGTTPAVVVAQVSNTALGEGTYTAQAILQASEDVDPQQVQVKLVLYPEITHPAPADLAFTSKVDKPTTNVARLAVAASSDDTLAWTVSQCPPWLTVSATRGNGPGEIFVSLAQVGIAVGLYRGQITIVDAATTSVVQTTSVQLAVAPNDGKYYLHLPSAHRP